MPYCMRYCIQYNTAEESMGTAEAVNPPACTLASVYDRMQPRQRRCLPLQQCWG